MKTILITGTSKGIGLSTAITLGRVGHKVYATMRNPENAKAFKDQISSEKLPIIIMKMDVDSDDSVDKTVKNILAENQTIDVLINNAGIERHGSIEEMPLSDIKAIMNTNYFGVIRCVKAVLPSMRTHKNGLIINVASVAGHVASSPLGAYAASKFALEAISEALAQEVKPFNIKVNIVEPGIIDTSMARNIGDAGDSIYPHSYRFAGMFTASLKTPTPPTLVADLMLDLVNQETEKLRHPVGPDAIPFIEWRASMSDEEWVNWNSADDATWYKSVEEVFGLDARLTDKKETV
ncbi:MAG: SDR family oxidoreductase [Eudoraea sp.]